MIDLKKVLIIVPCYMASKQINRVVEELLNNEFKNILVVDDCCPDNSSSNIRSKKIKVIKNKINLGVGGAFIKGFKYAINDTKYRDIEFIAKIDADGQHRIKDLFYMLYDINDFDLDLVKGNRYALNRLPKNQGIVRKLGNSFLTFFTKLASGYWQINDPVNGQFICRKNFFDFLVFNGHLENRFLFETSILLESSKVGAKIKDCPNVISYNSEISSLSPIKSIFQFSVFLLCSFINRIFSQYFFPNINIGSFFILSSIIFLSIGLIKGYIALNLSIATGIPTENGILSIILLTNLIGVSSLFAFLIIDQKTLEIYRPPIYRYLE